MGIREYHPEGDLDHQVTHVYSHPDGHGLGRHHVGPDDPPLVTRPATPGTVLEHLMPEYRVSMEDLDIQDGTELAHVDTDPDSGHLIFAWEDSQGSQRRTSFTPEQAAEFLTAQDDTEGQAG